MIVDDKLMSQAERRYEERLGSIDRVTPLLADKKLLQAGGPVQARKFLTRQGFSTKEINHLLSSDVNVVEMSESATLSDDGRLLERILGANDLMGVAFLELGLRVAATVCRVHIGMMAGRASGMGTGFMVSPRLLLTNNHVIGSARVAAASRAEFNYQFDADERDCAPAMFRLEPETFFKTNDELDYTLVAVEPVNAGNCELAGFGWNTLLEEEGKTIVGQWINIIQHPNGERKQLALGENQLIDIGEQFLLYRTDTAPGSSGSPVFNHRWEAIALHHAGVPRRDPQSRRILTRSGQPWTSDMGETQIDWIANEGARISRIIKDVREQVAGHAEHKAMLREMLSGGRFSPALRGAAHTGGERGGSHGGGSGGSGGGGHAPQCVVGADGSATWTIPLSVSVQLGGTAGSGAGSTRAGTISTGLSPAVADSDVRGDEAPDAPAEGPDRGAEPGGSPQSPEAAPLKEAREALGDRDDVLDIRLGYRFEDGWITDDRAIVVTRSSPAPEAEEAARGFPDTIGGLPVQVTDPTFEQLLNLEAPRQIAERSSLADPGDADLGEEIVYTPPPRARLEPVTGRMDVNLHMSPDCGWPELQKFLRGSKQSLVIGMYDFGARHILDELKALAAKPGFKLELVLQRGASVGHGSKANDLKDEEVVEQLKAAFGDRMEFSWVKIGSVNGWVATSYHIKVAVRDGNALWLSSGNWQSSNQPALKTHSDPADFSALRNYNREWHAIIANQALARTFRTYLRHDLTENARLADTREALPLALPELIEAEADLGLETALRWFPPYRNDREFTVTPLLTPDNYLEQALKLVEGARRSLLIQNQTFNAPGPQNAAELTRLMDAILRKQREGLDVRIIFRDIDAAKVRKNLEQLKERGFDMECVRVQANCHTKGVLVDGELALLGSHNLSQTGITLNRDASLLFDDDEVAGYFTETFEHDWANLARSRVGETRFRRPAAAGEAKAAEAAGVSVMEYLETL